MRGAWIEIIHNRKFYDPLKSLPMRGAWIEMGIVIECFTAVKGRSPCGERGLKYEMYKLCILLYIVAPHAGSVD